MHKQEVDHECLCKFTYMRIVCNLCLEISNFKQESECRLDGVNECMKGLWFIHPHGATGTLVMLEFPSDVAKVSSF